MACTNGFIHNNQCVMKCPLGMYGVREVSSLARVDRSYCSGKSILLKSTIACDSGCKSCKGPGSNECLSCKSGFYLSLSSKT